MNISSINKSVGRVMDYTVRKFCAKSLEKSIVDPAKYAASMLVLSIVSKDLVGCAMYTTQSYNNKKIPENKRKFVAAVDLMNGLIMVGGQLLIGKIIDARMTPKWFGKHYGSHIKYEGMDPITVENAKGPFAPDNILGFTKEVLEEKGIKANYQEVGKEMIKKLGEESTKYKAVKTGFGIVVVALATTALVKRTLAPLISTPLAGWFKHKFMDKHKKTGVKTDAKPEVQNDTKNASKTDTKPEDSQDTMLSHTVAPWAYTNKDGDKAVFSKISSI